MARQIHKRYQDPVEIIWLHAAKRCGIKVVRDDKVFASWNGSDTLTIGTPETLDPDDSLAQMILHELCHAMVASAEQRSAPDWGLDYDNPQHQVFEHSALRLQAWLADQYQLRSFLASTTDFRSYFDELHCDPLLPATDPAAIKANHAAENFDQHPWANTIHDALRQTAEIANIVGPVAEPLSLWNLKTQ